MTAGRRIRFGAVLVTVVLALSGFSSGHKSSGHGGCSGSSSGSKSSKRSSYDSSSGSNRNSRSTGSPSAGPTGAPARAEVVTCAGPGSPVATVKVTSLAAVERTVQIRLTFGGVSGTVESASADVTLKKGETRTIEVKPSRPEKAAEVTSCRLGPVTTA
ncbi:hypothetical protein [Streptomyces cirratus]|nr:hypothetical protein [Streptomyces cirratus]